MEARMKRVQIEKLGLFPETPFQLREDESLQELAESIREIGIISPLVVCKTGTEDDYEIISGQRRWVAARMIGMKEVPVMEMSVDRDQAIVMLVDSNLQRENLLPSEKAFAYKMKLEAVKRQGERTDLTSRQAVDKLKAADRIGQLSGESGRQVQRYIRLTLLIPPILKLVDEKKMALSPAVALSYLKKEEQEKLVEVMGELDCSPSFSQATQLKKLSELHMASAEMMRQMLSQEKANQKENIRIPMDSLRRFFPKSYTPKQIENAIIRLLERELQQKKERKER